MNGRSFVNSCLRWCYGANCTVRNEVCRTLLDQNGLIVRDTRDACLLIAPVPAGYGARYVTTKVTYVCNTVCDYVCNTVVQKRDELVEQRSEK